MADKKKKSYKSRVYDIKDGKITRKNKSCPKCGDGVFLANHGDRLSCGSCGYTESKKK
jgi:small subunit ribosomal protein S27Ae